MRNEKEMMDLIIGYAKRDEKIRAAVINGSRVNPNAKKDIFQDYDIVYLVTDVGPYKNNRDIIKYFGKIMILQTPEDMGDPPPKGDGQFSYLMQFCDGNRIDLSFYPADRVEDIIKDSLTVVLLDKDNIIGKIPSPNDKDYLPEEPTVRSFDDCCNEFWWVNPYVAKGLWREELIYAKYILDSVARKQLMKMLAWYFGIKTKFKKSPGKVGKSIKNQITSKLWMQLEKTYSDADFNNIWDSLFVMGRLFRETANYVANHYNFKYPHDDDRKVTNFILHIKKLPKDAKEIF